MDQLNISFKSWSLRSCFSSVEKKFKPGIAAIFIFYFAAELLLLLLPRSLQLPVALPELSLLPPNPADRHVHTLPLKKRSQITWNISKECDKALNRKSIEKQTLRSLTWWGENNELQSTDKAAVQLLWVVSGVIAVEETIQSCECGLQQWKHSLVEVDECHSFCKHILTPNESNTDTWSGVLASLFDALGTDLASFEKKELLCSRMAKECPA